MKGFRKVEANCILLGQKDLLVAVWGCVFKSVRVYVGFRVEGFKFTVEFW